MTNDKPAQRLSEEVSSVLLVWILNWAGGHRHFWRQVDQKIDRGIWRGLRVKKRLSYSLSDSVLQLTKGWWHLTTSSHCSIPLWSLSLGIWQSHCWPQLKRDICRWLNNNGKELFFIHTGYNNLQKPKGWHDHQSINHHIRSNTQNNWTRMRHFTCASNHWWFDVHLLTQIN